MRATAGVLLLLACAGRGYGQTPPVFGARVETVYVDAFVTRGGQAVRGLTAADFQLKDNGVAQAVELVTSDALPLVAVLAFDASGSIAGRKLAALQAAGAAFLDGLKPADEAALLTFSGEIQWASKPTRDRARVRSALARLQPRGGTAALDGLYAAITLPSSRARSLVVLFSDGEDNQSWLSERQLKSVAERSNALIHVVGIVPAEPPLAPSERLGAPVELPHNRVLRHIAEATGGKFWRAESPARLREAFAAIAEAMSHRYVLRFEPQGPAQPGWHRLELKLRGKSGNVEARRGYWVGGRQEAR
jgi:VWFA-related protein